MPVLGSPLNEKDAPVAPPRSEAKNLRAVEVPVFVREVLTVRVSMVEVVALSTAIRASESVLSPPFTVNVVPIVAPPNVVRVPMFVLVALSVAVRRSERVLRPEVLVRAPVMVALPAFNVSMRELVAFNVVMRASESVVRPFVAVSVEVSSVAPLTLREELNVDDAFTKIPAEVLVGVNASVKSVSHAPPDPATAQSAPAPVTVPFVSTCRH